MKKKQKGNCGKVAKKPASPVSPMRRAARWTVLAALAVFAALCVGGAWFARHPPAWIARQAASMPRFAVCTLMYFGDRTLMLTDALGWTGHDAVYDCDDPAPEGRVLYAGAPVRTGPPAPADIRTLDRGEFTIGWSDSLRHPVWVAYHVPQAARFGVGKRPPFRKDQSVSSAPAANAYARSGYDRGHMAPNYAIVTRFGPEEQSKTFLMSNIAPQSPALNRGPWRELEQRIADLWSARWGEIWVICGAISSADAKTRQTLPDTQIDIPTAYWMLIVAQDADGVRALALLMPQTVHYRDFPVHRIVTIDELEAKTGLELLPEMPTYLQNALEADRPTRLWPIRALDIVKLILLRFM